MNKILVFRLSAMGDVALTVPVIKGITEQYPDIKITLVTREFFAPFFYGIPGLKLFLPDLKGKHKGIKGLFRLYRELKEEESFDAVIDLHSVMRTWILDALFRISGKPVYSIKKGRNEKKRIVKTKEIKHLKHTTERYRDVFMRAGLEAAISAPPCFNFSPDSILRAKDFISNNSSGPKSLKIGIAPFAMHDTKIWGTEKINKLIQLVNSKYEADFYFFGGGAKETEMLKEFKSLGDNIHIVAGKLKLSEEIALMSKLSFMISMDSSNMHISSLAGTKTISVWGGTHPAFGFSALGQPDEFSIQTPLNLIPCRPCSVYGKKPCIFESPKCMDMISAQKVFDTLEKYNLMKV